MTEKRPRPSPSAALETNSQQESTAEDANISNKLTMDISCQLHHPLATISADTKKCYDRINHIIMSLLLLAIVGSMGPVLAMLHPIQLMKFYQRTERGDSIMFMGGLMDCYRRKGFESQIILPISGTMIVFFREICVDDTNLIVTTP